MRQERHVGYEIKALSNLLRRKVLEMTCTPEGDDFTEMQRSTASRLLKRLEAQGFIVRQSVERDARLKRVTTTAKADALHQEIIDRINSVEDLLTQGLSQAEVEQFLSTVEKLKQNLMKAVRVAAYSASFLRRLWFTRKS